MRGGIRIALMTMCLCLVLGAAGGALAQNENWWEGFHPPGVKKGSYDGKVNVIGHRDGNVYIAGDFDRVGEVPASNIARWDGRKWSALDEGVNGEITNMYLAQTAIFVCGSFSEAGGEPAPYVARWTGGQWLRMGDYDFNWPVYCFEYFQAALYAGGSFTHYDEGGDHEQHMWHLARWSGSEWHQAETHGPYCELPLDYCVSSGIYSMKSYGGRLWVGGRFNFCDGRLMWGLATWTPEEDYQAAGSGQGIGPHAGYSCNVTCMEDVVGSLYFGGSFLSADGEDALGLGYAASNVALHGITPAVPDDYWMKDLVDYSGGNGVLFVSDRWVRTRDGVGGWNEPIGSMRGATCADYGPEGLFVGGEIIGESSHTDAVARWDHGEWLQVGAGLAYMNNLNDEVRCALSWDGDLFIGGNNTGMRSRSYGIDDCNGTVIYDGADIVPLRPCVSPVNAATVYQGQLYIGGEFNPGGDFHLSRLARRVGDDWEGMGHGLSYGSYQGRVNDFAQWQGLLVIGGYFSDADGLACDNLVAWDGSFFSLVDDVDFSGDVNAVEVFAGDLIVAGNFSQIDGASYGRIARWDGESWDDMAGGMDSPVECLDVWNGDLYAAGGFSTAGGAPANRIARWTGTSWEPLGAGIGEGYEEVLALQASDVGLFAGGRFSTAGGAPAANVARWTGAAWETLGDGITPGHTTNATVRDFAIHDGHLYMVGTFLYAGGKLSANIARWSEEMTPVALLSFDLASTPGAVEASWELAGLDGAELRLEARLGGQRWEPAFAEVAPGRYHCRDSADPLAAGGEAQYLLFSREAGADWTLLRSARVLVEPAPAPRLPSLSAWPNPANPRFNVEVSLPAAAAVRLDVVDISGRRLATLHEGRLEKGRHAMIWDGRDGEGRELPSGIYLLSLSSPGARVAERLVLLR